MVKPEDIDTCPCCRHKIGPFQEYYICPICFWEIDFWQTDNPDDPDGANGISLKEGQTNYLKYGACTQNSVSHVRPPRAEEMS